MPAACLNLFIEAAWQAWCWSRTHNLEPASAKKQKNKTIELSWPATCNVLEQGVFLDLIRQVKGGAMR